MTSELLPTGDVVRTELPSGTLTFLFSDIEGSTALWERLPEAMSSALELHDRLLRDSFERASGVVFAHRGDGLSVVFTTASDAIRAAVAAVRATAAQDWSEVGFVRIRVGIHAGEAIRREGNYFGPPLNLTSRLTAAAHGNQILVSETVEGLVGGLPDDDVSLEDLGLWFFDGFARPERVYQVCDGALGEPPPAHLRAGRRAGATLPTLAGRFVGREAEFERIARGFDSARLVTLLGTGGTGKTRLAIEFAREVGDPFTAGPRFVDLTRGRDDSGLLPHLAEALAVRLRPGDETIESLARSVGDSSPLIVLDNCEHLVDTVAEHVSALLRHCPNVGVLATSREPLRVQGERVIDIPPLPTGSAAAPGAAVDLLLDRARAADASIVDDDPALHQLARVVDGLPLALELLAPRLAQMKPAELVEQLAEVGLLASIEGPSRRRRDAQLRTTFAWSYRMLDEPAQRLFAALSVCAGGTSIEGAQHVLPAAGVRDGDPRALVGALVDESLVIADTSGTHTRYRMLQPVREFATECLRDLGCVAAVEAAHIAYLAMFVEREAAGLRGPDEERSVDSINAEFDNLRVAALWCARNNRPELGFRIVVPLVDHLLARGRFEVGTWSLAIAEAPEADRDPLYPAGLGLAALTAMESGRLAAAEALSGQALAAERELGGRPAWTAYSVRVLLTAAGHLDGDLRATLRELRDVADSAGDPLGRAVYHFDRATIMKYGPTPERVMGSATELVALGQETGSPSILAMGLMIKAWGLAAESKPADAAEAFRESISLAAAVRNTTIAAIAHRDMLETERASLDSFRGPLQQFLDENDVAQVIVTVLGMLPTLLDLKAYDATARICGWISSTPWGKSAQLSEAMRRLDEHVDAATTANARAAGERMDLEQIVELLQTTVAQLQAR